MDSPIGSFTQQLKELGEGTGKDSWLSMIVRKELVEINMLLPEFQASNCLLTDMGEYLSRSINIIAQLAHRMANGNHIQTYTQVNINQTIQQNELSELGVIDNMTSKHKTLKKLVDRLQCASKDISVTWNECKAGSNGTGICKRTFPTSTIARTNVTTGAPNVLPSVEIGPDFPIDPSAYRQPLRDENTASGETCPVDNAPNSMIVENLLKDLHHRGTGSYRCPYGLECQKGGRSADGVLVVFERNSAFRAHLEKHAKQYKCTMLGCSNKSGFARLDLLQQHQANVPHNAPATIADVTYHL